MRRAAHPARGDCAGARLRWGGSRDQWYGRRRRLRRAPLRSAATSRRPASLVRRRASRSRTRPRRGGWPGSRRRSRAAAGVAYSISYPLLVPPGKTLAVSLSYRVPAFLPRGTYTLAFTAANARGTATASASIEFI